MNWEARPKRTTKVGQHSDNRLRQQPREQDFY